LVVVHDVTDDEAARTGFKVNGRTDGVGAVIANDIFLNDRRFSKDGNSSSANPTRILMAGLRVVLYQVANDERDAPGLEEEKRMAFSM
jgi:hypothetical protein